MACAERNTIRNENSLNTIITVVRVQTRFLVFTGPTNPIATQIGFDRVKLTRTHLPW